MTKILFTITFSFVLLVNCFTQDKYDYNWILGIDGMSNRTLIDFNTTPIGISIVPSNMWMLNSNTSMSDGNGELLFYSNGCYISNSNHELMLNGDSLGTPGIYNDVLCDNNNLPNIEGVVSLPSFDNSSLFYLFNLDFEEAYPNNSEYLSLAPLNLYYQIIDMSKNNGLGEVILKNQSIIQDTLARGSLKAVQHVNGIDWWVIIPESHSNCYYSILVTSNGIALPTKNCEGRIWDDNDGAQAVFSPDGNKYARFNYQNGLNVMDFDPMLGTFSNSRSVQFPNDNFPTSTGVSFSPNSRFIYASAKEKLFQFDILEDNLEESKVVVAEWDGFFNPSNTDFLLSKLAPDGKIYISSFGSTSNFHVIEYPDCKGLLCTVKQHLIELPILNSISIPNHPHYRNNPSNVNCDSVLLSTTDQNILDSPDIKVVPNPVSNLAKIELSSVPHDSYLKLFDYNSRVVLKQKTKEGVNTIDFSSISNGAYVLKYKHQKSKMGFNKIVVLR